MHVAIISRCPATVRWCHGFRLTEGGDLQRMRDGLQGTLGAPPEPYFSPHHPSSFAQCQVLAKAVVKGQESGPEIHVVPPKGKEALC